MPVINKPHTKKPKLVWDDLEQARIATATTLLTNVKSIKGLLETDGFDDVADKSVLTHAATVLKDLSEDYTYQLRAIQVMHVGKTGAVVIEDIHTYMFIATKYAGLTKDIMASVVGLSRVLVNLKEQVIKSNTPVQIH